jgi:site-specific DNA-methyltransferase (adenine-specific)
MASLAQRNKILPEFFGQVTVKGEKASIFTDNSNYNEYPILYYKHPNGELWKGDSITWLKSLKENSVDMVFADPPYNIKKADWDDFESTKKYLEWSVQWIEQCSRILKPTGSLYICGFSEILADLKAPAMSFFKSCRWIVWHYKNKANLGNDWGRSHESILHLRKLKSFQLNIDSIRIPYSLHTLKYPSHPQAETSQYSKNKEKYNEWMPNPNGAKPKDVLEIPTTCNGMHEKTQHPTQKPEELLRKIILSSSNEGEIVLDPFVGSGTSAVCSEQLNRKWLGCDLSIEYLNWAVDRIEMVEGWSIERWISYDFENLQRRSSIR